MIFAIDPGNIESAYVCIDRKTQKPVRFGKIKNEELRDLLTEIMTESEELAFYMEMIGHYGTGMPAGKTVFDTCVWIGRFLETIEVQQGTTATLVLRPTVKTHLCGSARAKDANVTQALVDRFAPGQSNFGKGTKANPGWFYGFSKDVWQSYALAVYAADTIREVEQP